MRRDIFESENLNFADCIAGVRSDWRSFVPRLQRRQQKVCHWGLWELIAAGYALAEILTSSECEWNVFADLPFWDERQKALKQGHSLRHAMQYVFGHASGDWAGRASGFANALEDVFYSDHPLPAEDIPQLIEQSGGIDEMIENFRGRKIAPDLPTQASAPSSETTSDVDDPFDEDSGDVEESVANVSSRDASLLVGRSTKSRSARYPSGIGAMRRIEILVDPACFDETMEMEAGPVINLRIRVVDNGESDFRRIEAVPEDET